MGAGPGPGAFVVKARADAGKHRGMQLHGWGLVLGFVAASFSLTASACRDGDMPSSGQSSTSAGPPAEATDEAPEPAEGDDRRAADRVRVIDPYARAMPPSAANSAAFMTLKNDGEAAALVGAKASVSETVELHTHTEVEGAMQMRKVDRIPIDAQAEAVLKPGGLHIMLIGLNGPLSEGQQFDLTLQFDDGSETTVPVDVRAVDPHSSH